MSVLFWVTTYTLVLVPLFLVARPLISDEVRRVTPVMFIVLITPLVAAGLYTKLAAVDVAADDSSNSRYSLSSLAAATLVKTDADLESKLSGTPAQGVSAAKICGRIGLTADSQQQELPLEIMLNDDHAMTQGTSLSAYDEVDSSARISRTGNAAESVRGLQVQSVRTAVEIDRFVDLCADTVTASDEKFIAGR